MEALGSSTGIIPNDELPTWSHKNCWASLHGHVNDASNQTKCHHLRAHECKCKCLQLMGHLFDSPVQVLCLPIALQQLSAATCTNWQPPGANSGVNTCGCSFHSSIDTIEIHWGVSQLSNLPFRPSAWICLNHIESARWKPTIYFHELPSKFGVCKRGIVQVAHHWKGARYACILWIIMMYHDYYYLLLCLWFPSPSLSHTWGPPNLSWLTLQWLRYTRQCAPPRPRGRLWYARECDLQGNEGHATLKRTTKPVELLWTVDEGRCHIGSFPSWMSFPYNEALDLNYQYNSWLKQPIDVWTDAIQRALCPSWHHIMATLWPKNMASHSTKCLYSYGNRLHNMSC